MVKKRIIPVQLLLDNRLVKTVQFNDYRDVGDPVMSSKVYSNQDADELVFLNINREERTIAPLIQLIEKVSEVCFMPLALGGGIRTAADAAALIHNGADKVVVNSQCYHQPEMIEEIAGKFGAQAVVVSIDCRKERDGAYGLYSDCGRRRQNIVLQDHVRRIIQHGAGEIFINSIDRDGTMEGYDLDLIRQVKEVATVPVIGCGGAGTFVHMRDAFLTTDVSALACGSLFNFGDNNPLRAKAFLKNYDIPLKII